MNNCPYSFVMNNYPYSFVMNHLSSNFNRCGKNYSRMFYRHFALFNKWNIFLFKFKLRYELLPSLNSWYSLCYSFVASFLPSLNSWYSLCYSFVASFLPSLNSWYSLCYSFVASFLPSFVSKCISFLTRRKNTNSFDKSILS